MAFTRHTAKDVAGYTKMIHDLKWNREGNYIGMISGDKTVKVGQLEKAGTFQNVHSIPNSAQMSQLCWNPIDNSRLGLCGDDKMVELWDVRASRASAKLPTAGSNINIAWSPCGNYIAVGNKNDVVTVLDVRTSTVFKKRKFAYEVNELTWTANPNFLLAATGGDGVGSIDILSLSLESAAAGGACGAGNSNSNGGVNSSGGGGSSVGSAPVAAATAAMNLSSRQSNASSSSESAQEQLVLVDTVAAHVSNCVSLRTDNECRRLALGSLDYFVSLWDLEDLVCKHTIAMESEIRCMSFSGDGSYLAVISEDPTILICNTDTGEGLARLVNRHKMNALSWHPKQNLLALAVEDKSPSPQYLRFVAFAE